MGLVKVHLVVRVVIVVAGVVLVLAGVVLVLAGAVLVVAGVVFVVAGAVLVVAGVVLVLAGVVLVVAGVVLVVRPVVLIAVTVQHKLVDGSIAVMWRIDFIPQRYISCGLCARRTRPRGSAPRDCLPCQSWCSADRGRSVTWLKLSR